MSVVAFDTLKFAQTLRDKAKLTSEQAEGISEAFADAVSEQIATKSDFINLATKQDLADLKKQDLAELDKKISGTKDDISSLKKDISGLQKDISGLQKDISELQKDMSGLKNDISGTKNDIFDLKKDVSGLKKDISDIHRLIAETNTRIVDSKAETLKWVIGLSMAQIAAMFALFRLLPGWH